MFDGPKLVCLSAFKLCNVLLLTWLRGRSGGCSSHPWLPSCAMQVLGPSDKAQSTMVAAWLTELLLDQINRDLLAAAGQHTQAYLQHVEQLR